MPLPPNTPRHSDPMWYRVGYRLNGSDRSFTVGLYPKPQAVAVVEALRRAVRDAPPAAPIEPVFFIMPRGLENGSGPEGWYPFCTN